MFTTRGCTTGDHFFLQKCPLLLLQVERKRVVLLLQHVVFVSKSFFFFYFLNTLKKKFHQELAHESFYASLVKKVALLFFQRIIFCLLELKVVCWLWLVMIDNYY